MSTPNFNAGEPTLPLRVAATTAPTGYVCSCGVYVAANALHTCFSAGQSFQFATPAATDPRTAAALERIATALEKLAGIGPRR